MLHVCVLKLTPELLLYMAKHSRGKTFTVTRENKFLGLAVSTQSE